MSLLVAGTVAIDHIKTPSATAEDLLGGSAAYAALAASFFIRPVHLVGIVGHDFPQEHLAMLEERGIGLGGVEHSAGESFTWSGEYLDDMNRRETHRVGLNVLENWAPQVPDEARSSEVVILANMSPDNQLAVLEQCPSARFVVADTMDLWIEIAHERLLEVMKRIDLLVINETEAREFSGENNLIVAGGKLQDMGPRYVVIKLGEHGAFLFGDDEDHFFSCAAYPLPVVNDPTGAGDSFLGSLAGRLIELGAVPPSFEQLKGAVAYGAVVASFTCEAFSTRFLEETTRSDIDARLARFRDYVAFA